LKGRGLTRLASGQPQGTTTSCLEEIEVDNRLTESVRESNPDWTEECQAATAAYYEERERQQRDLRDWARYTLETGDTACACRGGWQCFRCRVHEIVYPVDRYTRAVPEWPNGTPPF